MSAYPCPNERHDPNSVDSAPNRPPGETVSLADRRYELLVSAARDFLDRARSFGWGAPPFAAPSKHVFRTQDSRAAGDVSSASPTSEGRL